MNDHWDARGSHSPGERQMSSLDDCSPLPPAPVEPRTSASSRYGSWVYSFGWFSTPSTSIASTWSLDEYNESHNANRNIDSYARENHVSQESHAQQEHHGRQDYDGRDLYSARVGYGAVRSTESSCHYGDDIGSAEEPTQHPRLQADISAQPAAAWSGGTPGYPDDDPDRHRQPQPMPSCNGTSSGTNNGEFVPLYPSEKPYNPARGPPPLRRVFAQLYTEGSGRASPSERPPVTPDTPHKEMDPEAELQTTMYLLDRATKHSPGSGYPPSPIPQLQHTTGLQLTNQQANKGKQRLSDVPQAQRMPDNHGIDTCSLAHDPGDPEPSQHSPRKTPIDSSPPA